MNGARKLVKDFVMPFIQHGYRVLDVCCGDAWLKEHVLEAGALWSGIDKTSTTSEPKSIHLADLGDVATWELLLNIFPNQHVVVSSWGLQHLLGEEALGWSLVHRLLAPRGLFLYVGRWFEYASREMGRGDPLNGHSVMSISALAMTTGFEVIDTRIYRYHDSGYESVSPCHSANALCVAMRKLQ